MTEKRDVEIRVKCTCEGFALDLDAVLAVDQVGGLMRKLREAGIAPAQSPYLWDQTPNGNGAPSGHATNGAPTCPVHGTAMRPSSKGGGYYCPRKVEDGGYCRAKV